MIWQWWGAMFVTGLVVGCIGAWTTQAARVFMKTLAVPLLLILTRVALPNVYPVKTAPQYWLADFVLIAVGGVIGDYFLGLKLGRNDRAGFRTDSVGH